MELQGFIDAASPCLTKMKEFETKLCLLLQKAKTCDTFPQSSPIIGSLLEALNTSLNCNEVCIPYIEKSISCLNPSVPWHPDKKDTEMLYLLGDSPWSFWLTYNMSSEIDDLIKKIKVRWRSGSLSKALNPEVGCFVCCCDNKSVFRGIILSIISKKWVRVLNVDNGRVQVVMLDTCHDMIKEFCEPHANAIHCCLTKDEFDRKMWNSDLAGLFQSVLQDSRLTVRILNKLEEVPSKYLIDLFAYNDRFEVGISISEWISSKLLPAVQLLYKVVDQNELYISLDEKLLYPFAVCSSDSPKKTELGEASNSREKIKDLTIPLKKHQENQVSGSMLNWHQEDENLRHMPRNRLAKYIITEQTKKYKETPLPKEEASKYKLLFERVVDVAEFRPLGSYIPYIPESEVAELHPPNSSPKTVSNSSAFLPYTPNTEVAEFGPLGSYIPYIPESEVAELHPPNSSPKTVSNSSAFLPYTPNTEVAELHPPNSSPKTVSNSSAFLPYTPNTEVAEFGPLDSSAKDISISINCLPYIPESEVAELHPPNSSSKKVSNSSAFLSYTPKTEFPEFGLLNSSLKEVVSNNPYNSKTERKRTEAIYKEEFDRINLPRAGSVQTVTVNHVLSANTFYATLPDILSAKLGKTTTALISDLNKIECLKSLKSFTRPPVFGQLLVAYSQKKKLWLRGVVSGIEWSDDHIHILEVEVYFVDYGIYEDVSLDECKKIPSKFTSHPFQAIYCTIFGLSDKNSQEESERPLFGMIDKKSRKEPGKLFLEALILNKEIEVKVAGSFIEDTRMQVIPYLIQSGLNVADIMLKSGYCSATLPSHFLKRFLQSKKKI